MSGAKLLAAGVAGAMVMLVAHPVASAADVSVGVEVNSVDDFYEPLSTEGFWVDIGSYGRCWHPYGVDATWRPYCEGTWVWTNDGWYWQSDEPWGWACYHYGRWTLDPYYGWVWVPDVVWGPAWVCWREGGGYCGWAPLPPRWHAGVAISAGLVPDNWFVFVGDRHFGEPIHERNLIVNNAGIARRTTLIAKTRTTVNHRVIADGPRVQDLQRINREHIRTSSVSELRRHERTPAIVRRPASAREAEPRSQPPKTVTPEREQPHNNPPEIIRGAPSAPVHPPAEQPEHREAPPAEQKEHIEPHPAEPPPPEKAPPPRERPPEEHGHEDEHGNGGR